MAHPKLTDAQRQQIEEMLGTASYADIAKVVGCSKGMVAKVKSEMDAGGPSVHESVHVRADLPARARARDYEQTVHKDVNVHVNVHESDPVHVAGRRIVAETMTAHLLAEIDLYNEARARLSNPDDAAARYDVIQHGKLVQSALRDLAKWCGLDRGTMESDEEVRIVDEEVADRLDYDELCKVIEDHALPDNRCRMGEGQGTLADHRFCP